MIATSPPQMPPATRKRRRPAPDERRRAILDAALESFAERGFSATRMEDVARRAGIAKGTLYLYFTDKEAMFEALVREAADPVFGELEQTLKTFEGSTRDFLRLVFMHLTSELVVSRRRHIVRLMLGEGERFPALSDFYYREVVARGLSLLRAVNARALARGEITSDAALRFPQLIVAPAIIAAVWEGLFGRHEQLDVPGLLAAHGEVMLRGLGWKEPE